MDLAELFDSCSANCHPGSDCRAVALGADKSEQYAMKTIRGHILEKRGWLADVQQKNVHVASVKNVAESGTATGFHGQFRETGLLRDFVESSVTIITMHEQRLAKARTGFQSVNLRINVAVGDQNVEPGVVIHVKEGRAPTDVGIAGLADAGGPTDIVKTLRTRVAIERVGLLFKVGRKEAQAAAVVVVAPINAHVAKLHAFAAEGHARDHPDVGEGAVVIVVIEVIWDGVIRHQEVGPAIVVVIHPHDAEAIVADVVVDASFDGNFFKSSVTTIVVKEIAFAFEAPRSALHENALEAAEFVTSEFRKVVHVQMGIAGDEKIHETIAVVVAPRRPGHKATADDTGLFSDVLELTVAEGVIKGAAPEAGHK